LGYLLDKGNFNLFIYFILRNFRSGFYTISGKNLRVYLVLSLSIIGSGPMLVRAKVTHSDGKKEGFVLTYNMYK